MKGIITAIFAAQENQLTSRLTTTVSLLAAGALFALGLGRSLLIFVPPH